jgi:tetratricopeptide (TPR) repeat protein
MNRKARRGARKRSQSASSLSPQNEIASPAVARLLALALQHHQTGRLADAERLYLAMLRVDPEHFDAQHLLGVLRYQQGRNTEALELIAAALVTNPNAALALSNLGNVHGKLGCHQEALASYDRALTIKPDYPEALNNRGNALRQLKRHDEALTSYESALAARPDFAEAFCSRGSTLHELRRFDEALASYDRALALRPDFADALNNRALTLYELKRFEEALASYECALSVRPDFAEVHYYRGNVLSELKRYDEALTSYDRAVSLRPDYAEAHYNRGNVLKELKRLDEALESYDRALSVRPDYAEVLNSRGAILRQLERHDEALASYDRALAVRPDYAEAFYNRGNALGELRRYDEALASYDRALSVTPDYPEALHGRGFVLRQLCRLDEALASYDRALSARPDYAAALNNRGVILQELKQHDEALVSYERALALDSCYAEAYNNLGSVLTELGRLEEARDYFESAVRLSPRTPLFYFSLVMANQISAGDPHLGAMQEMAQDMGSLSAEAQVYLHFALGKALADVKQYERSFHHLLNGNAVKRRQITYDEAATFGLLQRIQTVFTPELIHSKHGLGNPSAVPIFIVGMPRSGTTLVEQILASHPKVYGAGELNDFDTVMARLCDRARVPFPELARAIADKDLHELGTSYFDAVTERAPEAPRITDKMPQNCWFVGLIHLALPHARIIHTRRDPVDTCLSCFSTLFAAGQEYSYDLNELGRYYRAYQVLMQHWRDVLPNGTILEVAYEDVIDDLEGQARRLVAHCGLEWDEACLAFHKTQRIVQTASVTQVRQPIFRSSVGRWRHYRDLLRPLLEALNIEQAESPEAPERSLTLAAGSFGFPPAPDELGRQPVAAVPRQLLCNNRAGYPADPPVQAAGTGLDHPVDPAACWADSSPAIGTSAIMTNATVINPNPNTITIDGTAYETDKLSDAAKQQLSNVRLAELEIARLNIQLAIAQTARAAYGAALREALAKQDM